MLYYLALLLIVQITQYAGKDRGSLFNLLDNSRLTHAGLRNGCKTVINDDDCAGIKVTNALSFLQEKRDLITGLKTRTNAGRPNWDKVSFRLHKMDTKKTASL